MPISEPHQTLTGRPDTSRGPSVWRWHVPVNPVRAVDEVVRPAIQVPNRVVSRQSFRGFESTCRSYGPDPKAAHDFVDRSTCYDARQSGLGTIERTTGPACASTGAAVADE